MHVIIIIPCSPVSSDRVQHDPPHTSADPGRVQVLLLLGRPAVRQPRVQPIRAELRLGTNGGTGGEVKERLEHAVHYRCGV